MISGRQGPQNISDFPSNSSSLYVMYTNPHTNIYIYTCIYIYIYVHIYYIYIYIGSVIRTSENEEFDGKSLMLETLIIHIFLCLSITNIYIYIHMYTYARNS